MADRIEKLRYQKGQRLLIHKPPQHGGSIVIQRLPAYLIGCDPGLRVRDVTYNQSHSQRFSEMNLNIMRQPEYQEMFPEVRLPKIVSVGEWSTEQREAYADAQPSFSALGLGSGFVGIGCDIVIIDDPYRARADAFSGVINERIWAWRTTDLEGRLNPDTNIVVMFHRYHEDDFAGRLIAEGGWELMRFPALGDSGEDDPTGRAIDEPLSPRYSYEYLSKRRDKEPIVFAGTWQGKPQAPEGNLIKIAKIVEVPAEPFGEDVKGGNGWDLAASASDEADRTSVTRGKRKNDVFYICDNRVWRLEDDDDIPNNRNDAIRETISEYQSRDRSPAIIEEPFGNAKPVSTRLKKKLVGLTYKLLLPKKKKVERADQFISAVNAGLVRIVKTGDARKDAWIYEFKMELAAFPFGPYDDRVDSTVILFNELMEVVQRDWKKYRVI